MENKLLQQMLEGEEPKICPVCKETKKKKDFAAKKGGLCRECYNAKIRRSRGNPGSAIPIKDRFKY